MDYNKRLSSISQYFRDILLSGFSIKNFLFSKKNGISSQTQERIMLSVTKVNGCKICSYYHATEALKNGLDESEIKQLLEDNDSFPDKDAIAIAFAIHYADYKGKPLKENIEQLIKCYGKKTALSIIGICRQIMIGNTLGIAADTFRLRLKGKKVKGSSFFREIFIFVITVLIIPFYILAILVGFITPTNLQLNK